MPHPWGHSRSGWMGSEYLMELWVSLFIAGELGQMAIKAFLQLNWFSDSLQEKSVLLTLENTIHKKIQKKIALNGNEPFN